uniref:Uncharacterized protein n=1 Tax=Schistosoma mansoni TaxID=6183 RepID=A0A3Q0KUZ6_SCHMA
MTALYSHRLVYLFLGRSLNTASTLIRPHLTDKHRGIIESCCTIEVTADRLSYASLCLDPDNKNSVILSSWNSLPLNLPSGKEFRPYMCSSMFKAITQRLVHDICSSEKLTSGQFALVYVSSKLSSASLVRAGFMGYLIGYLCTESIKQEFLPPSNLPIFTMNHSYRKHILSSWRSKFVSRNPECIIRGIEDLLTTLPKLSFANSNSIATYTNIFLNIDGNLSNPSVHIPNENQNITYNQLSLANVLVDGYGFLVHGIMGNKFASLELLQPSYSS